MKHERAERMLAVVLAAVLLAGCGGASSPEAASSLPRQEKKTHASMNASMDAAGASIQQSRKRKTGQTTASRSTKTRCSPSGRSIRLWYSRMAREYP